MGAGDVGQLGHEVLLERRESGLVRPPTHVLGEVQEPRVAVGVVAQLVGEMAAPAERGRLRVAGLVS